ncbi:hypothetical protein KEM56_006657 [Ascosphaera pollenicola]|nr:hypothetical protein KEM56_006657 [Ascosphaera pollenicola]
MVKIDVKIDYYAVLGISSDATDSDIKKAYRKLALQYHPDRNPGKETEVLARFQQIATANEILTTPSTKTEYDSKRYRHNAPYSTRANARRQQGPTPSWSANTQSSQSFANAYARYKSQGQPRPTTAPRPNPYQNAPKSAWDQTHSERRKTDEAFRAFRNMNSSAKQQTRPAPTARQNASTEKPNQRPHSAYEHLFTDPKKDPRRKERRKNGFSPEDPEGDEPMAKNTSSYSSSNRARESFAHMFAATDDDSSSSPKETSTQQKPEDSDSSKQKDDAFKTKVNSEYAQQSRTHMENEKHTASTAQSQRASHPTQEQPSKQRSNPESPPTPSSGTSSQSNSETNPPKRRFATPSSRKARVSQEFRNNEQNQRPESHPSAGQSSDSGSNTYLFGTWATGGTNSWLNNGPKFNFASNTAPINSFVPPFSGAFGNAQNKSQEESTTSSGGKDRYCNPNPYDESLPEHEDPYASGDHPHWDNIHPPVSHEGILLDLDDPPEKSGTRADSSSLQRPDPSSRFGSQRANENFHYFSTTTQRPTNTAFASQDEKKPEADEFAASGDAARSGSSFSPFETTDKAAPAHHTAASAHLPFGHPPSNTKASFATSNGHKNDPSTSEKSPLDTFAKGNWADLLTPSWTRPADWIPKSSNNPSHSGSDSRVRTPGKTSGAVSEQSTSGKAATSHSEAQAATADKPEARKFDHGGWAPMDIDWESDGPPFNGVKLPHAQANGASTFSKAAGSTKPFSGNKPDAQPFVNLSDLRQTAPFTTTNSASVNDLNDVGASLPFQSKAAAPTVKQTRSTGVLQRPPKAPKVPLGLSDPDKRSEGISSVTQLWEQYMRDMNLYFQGWKRFNKIMVTHFNERQRLLETHLSPNWMNAIGDDFKVKIEDVTDDEDICIRNKQGSFNDYMTWLAEDEKIREHWNVAQERHVEVMHELSKARKVMQKMAASQCN